MQMSFHQNCLFVDLFIWVGLSLTLILPNSLDLLVCELQESTSFSLSSTRNYVHVPLHLDFNLFFIFHFMWMVFELCVCLCTMHKQCPQVEVGVRLSELGLCKVVSRDIWVLGVGPGSSGRTTSAINIWTISPVSGSAHLAFLLLFFFNVSTDN